MERHIHSMTGGQTRRVCERALALTRTWLRGQGVTKGQYGQAGAFADLNRDCYVGVVKVSYEDVEGRPVEGRLVWTLDHTFTVIAAPEVEVVVGGG